MWSETKFGLLFMKGWMKEPTKRTCGGNEIMLHEFNTYGVGYLCKNYIDFTCAEAYNVYIGVSVP